MSDKDKAGNCTQNKQLRVECALGCDPFDIADQVIEQAYPNFYNKEKGWWGAKRIPNWGILRGAIAAAIHKERKQPNENEITGLVEPKR